MHSANMLAEVVDLVVFSSSLEKTPAIPVSGKSCRGSFWSQSEPNQINSWPSISILRSKPLFILGLRRVAAIDF